MTIELDLSAVEISADHSRLDLTRVHQVLADSYWAKNIPLEIFERSVEHSLCYGGYWQGQQIAFARVITDQATFAYLADVFVLPEFSGQGVAKKLNRFIIDDDRIAQVRRFCLATRDAHTLYESVGFERFTDTDKDRFMQMRRVRSYSC